VGNKGTSVVRYTAVSLYHYSVPKEVVEMTEGHRNRWIRSDDWYPFNY